MKRTLPALSFLSLFAANALCAQQPMEKNYVYVATGKKAASTHERYNHNQPVKPAAVEPDADNAGLKLPAGFGALKVADGIGRARHIAVTEQGDIYVKMNGRIAEGRGILKLHDSNGDGRADETTGIANYNGTGIAIRNGYLYASSDNDVYRYKLDAQGNIADAKGEKIISGLLNRHHHESKSIALDNDGNIYVNIGAFSNSCQEKPGPGSKGMMPCNILDSAGGIWQFRADKLNQVYSDGIKFATGLRNVVGLDWNTQTNQLFVMQHGRDDLHVLWPDLFTERDNAEKPAECMYVLKKGDNAGWPYIYYDPEQKKKIVAPEYGGDGKKEGSKEYIDPVMAFPAHLAPNGLLFYTGNMFPAKYKNGAFVAFHGSWNRAPLPQEGYYVVFVPFENGKPTGKWEVFASGFTGMESGVTPRSAAHRPCGLAQGPDGSLYISEDSKGTIYRVVYNGK
ncbi:PQQ-dependent sugar dehydrogenase [Sediminibacterium roseum]|nr:PQQ-dependent sugar dehydrogenase [Sediminibacterium roseum]